MPAKTDSAKITGLSLASLLKYDGAAGTVVFLVALPLCLGIALASGAPLFSGVIAGIVGGIVVGTLSSSHVSVSGPASGLALIVLMAIHTTGTYRGLLTAVALSGLLQVAFGLMKLGIIADYFPNAVIKGLLAGIGVVIILKQVPHALGWDKDYEGDFSFLQIHGNNTFSDIGRAISSASLGAVLIFVGSLALFLVWEKAAKKTWTFRLIPSPLAAVVFGIALNQLFGRIVPALHLASVEHLVNLPVPTSLGGFFRQFTLPDLTVISHKGVWISAATIAIVGSLETLLSLEAADRLDPYKRISSANRELTAQGIGNIVCGCIGGLPVTSVVVRTAANVEAGARTRISTLTHGVLLLVAAVLLPGLLRLTPLASLATILIVVGFKLTKPTLYREVFLQGWTQFLPFLATLLGVIFTDLLTGVLVGLILGVFFVIRTNHHEAITMVNQESNYLLRFNKDPSFIHKCEFRRKLRQLPNNSHVLIDGARALFIDRDIQEIVSDFRDLAYHRNIEIELKHWHATQI